MTSGGWRIRLSGVAERDIVEILRATLDRFGTRQAGVYRVTLLAALRDLGEGPGVAGSVARDEIMVGLRSLHVARGRRRGRHFVLYRVVGGDMIEIVRILHDGMELAGHIPPRDGGGEEGA